MGLYDVMPLEVRRRQVQRTILIRTAQVFILSLIINFATLFLLVLGSGVMPINFSKLFLITVPVSIVIASISYFVRRWVVFIIIALMVINFFATGRIFGYFLDNGFERAKGYATSLALEVAAIHDRTGNWPANLKEIPVEKRPRIDPATIEPYKYYQEDGLYISIGGFYINYSTDKQVPRLAVERRDISVTWNWSDSKWEETP